MHELNYMEIKGLRGERLSRALNPEPLLSCPITWQKCMSKSFLKSSPSTHLSPIPGIVQPEADQRRTRRSGRATFHKEWRGEKSGGPEGACPPFQDSPVVQALTAVRAQLEVDGLHQEANFGQFTYPIEISQTSTQSQALS